MKCKLVKLSQLSGINCSIYSAIVNDDKNTLFESFVSENKSSFLSEIQSIYIRLQTIGKNGARENFFKLNEGAPGDGVCALYDEPNSNLRLYCIRYGSQIIILGDGGHKPKSIRRLQEDKKLTETNYFLRWLSKEITERHASREIKFTPDGLDFIGDFEFEKYEDE